MNTIPMISISRILIAIAVIAFIAGCPTAPMADGAGVPTGIGGGTGPRPAQK